MQKNHCLAQLISNAAGSSFVTKLEDKAQWFGKTVLKVGKIEPFSNFCNVCGY
jgi:putative transposase